MIVYAVQYVTHDGIVEQTLFVRECSAKTECRKKNRLHGELYEVVRLEVKED